ncbi:MAG: response regulator [Phycisphaerae bacterium]
MSQEVDLSKVKVLVVDDSEDNIDLIAEYLDGIVSSVIRAASGEACISLATEHEPDVILLDLMMPNMNGLSVIRSIHAIERLAHIPVILQTAYADRDNILAARRLGCNYILAKPLSRDRLLAELRKALLESPKHARVE